jgi:hypothetical protein
MLTSALGVHAHDVFVREIPIARLANHQAVVRRNGWRNGILGRAGDLGSHRQVLEHAWLRKFRTPPIENLANRRHSPGIGVMP